MLSSNSCTCPLTAGFNPTFGPAWVPLYGSLPGGRLRDGLQSFNEGLGEGIWFRGRLLVAVSMEVFEGRVEPKSSKTTQGSGLSQLTGKKKKKKTRQGQTPAGILQPASASTSEDVPEIPSAMEVEVEELLPLPEVGAGVTLNVRHHDALSNLGTSMKNPVYVHTCAGISKHGIY